MMNFDPSELKFASKYAGGGKNNKNRKFNNGGNRDRDRDRNRNNNNGNNRDRRNDRGNKTESSSILSSGMSDYERGYGDRAFDNESVPKETTGGNVNIPNEVLDAGSNVENFLNDYAEACSLAGNQVTDVIRDEFWPVAKAMTHYYDPKYAPITAGMNKVLDVISSQRFAVSLVNLLNGEEIEGWHDGVSDIWKDVMFTVATTITTCHKKMKDETVSNYIELISSSGLAGKDINHLVKELGITKDLATDLTIAIPVIPVDMTDITLRQFYGAFVMSLMEHAEENIDVLDRGTQGNLFSFFFGKDHIALKAIGRMLAAPKIVKFANESQKMIYAEYLSMLSDRLDAYDIKDIKYVLRFIVNEKKRLGKDTAMLFGDLSIVEYDSVRKAEFELIGSDSEAKEYLVMG